MFDLYTELLARGPPTAPTGNLSSRADLYLDVDVDVYEDAAADVDPHSRFRLTSNPQACERAELVAGKLVAAAFANLKSEKIIITIIASEA